MQDALVIRSSSIHAAGCYTTKAIKKGTRVCEYDGPRFSKEAADQRYADRFITYLFSCGDAGEVIDGSGSAMFINHCCEPNCETEEVDGRIYVCAVRDIAAGEELTYEYHLYDSDDGGLLLWRGEVPGNDVQRGRAEAAGAEGKTRGCEVAERPRCEAVVLDQQDPRSGGFCRVVWTIQ